RGGRFARSQRNARKRRISRGSWNGCRSCIRTACSFSSAVGLEQAEEKRALLENRSAEITTELIQRISQRLAQSCAVVGQTQRLHPVASMIFPAFTVILIRSRARDGRKLSATRPAEFRGVRHRLDLDLLNSFRNDPE